jgi:hypothetical protein
MKKMVWAALVCTVILVGLPASPDAGTGEVCAMEARGSALDGAVTTLSHLMLDSRRIRERVAGKLSLDSSGPGWDDDSEGGDSEDRLLQTLEAAVDSAIQKSGRYQRATSAIASSKGVLLPASGIVRLERTYPGVPGSDTREDGELSVTVWVCPDRMSALALFWLRRGGCPASSDASKAGLEKPDARYRILEANEPPGELAYWHEGGAFMSVPQDRGDVSPGTDQSDRMGFLRRNVVVEASSYVFIRISPQQTWKTVGMGGALGVWPLFHELDRYFEHWP